MLTRSSVSYANNGKVAFAAIAVAAAIAFMALWSFIQGGSSGASSQILLFQSEENDSRAAESFMPSPPPIHIGTPLPTISPTLEPTPEPLATPLATSVPLEPEEEAEAQELLMQRVADFIEKEAMQTSGGETVLRATSESRLVDAELKKQVKQARKERRLKQSKIVSVSEANTQAKQKAGELAKEHEEKANGQNDSPANESLAEECVIQPPEGTLAVIVRVKDARAVRRMVGVLGGCVTGESALAGAVAVRVPLEGLEVMQYLDAVKGLYANRRYSATLLESVPLVKAPSAWAAGYNGSGVRIGVVDSGVDANHSMLAGRVVAQKDFTGSGTVQDEFGHGTHVAGIAAGSTASGGAYSGVAPQALVINAKVLNHTGAGTTASILAGLEWAANPDGDERTSDGAKVMVLSLGGAYETPDDPLHEAIKALTEKGVVVVASSGNCASRESICQASYCSGFVGVTTPGTSPDAITVGAVDNGLAYACFSGGAKVGEGIKPDVVAPGVEIASSIPGGYRNATGTSMAAPHVAGAAAILLEQYPGLSPKVVKLVLEATATDLGVVGKDSLYGSGLIDLNATLKVNLSEFTNVTLTAPQSVLRGSDVLLKVNTSVEVTSVTGKLSPRGGNASDLNFTKQSTFIWETTVNGSLTMLETDYFVSVIGGGKSANAAFSATNYSVATSTPKLFVNESVNITAKYKNFEPNSRNAGFLLEVLDEVGDPMLYSQSEARSVINGSQEEFVWDWKPNKTGVFTVRATLLLAANPVGSTQTQVRATMPRVGVARLIYSPERVTKGENASYTLTAENTGNFTYNASLEIYALLQSRLLKLLASPPRSFAPGEVANITATGALPLQGGDYVMFAYMAYGDRKDGLSTKLRVDVPSKVLVNLTSFPQSAQHGSEYNFSALVENNFTQPLEVRVYAEVLKQGRVAQSTLVDGFLLSAPESPLSLQEHIVLSESFNSLNSTRWKNDSSVNANINPAGELSLVYSGPVPPHKTRALSTSAPIPSLGTRSRFTMLVKRESEGAFDDNQPQFEVWFLRSSNNTNSEGSEAGTGYRLQICEGGNNSALWRFENGIHTLLWSTQALGGCSRDAYHNLTIDLNFNAPASNINVSLDGLLKATSVSDKTYAQNAAEHYFSYGMGYSSRLKISELVILDLGQEDANASVRKALNFTVPFSSRAGEVEFRVRAEYENANSSASKNYFVTESTAPNASVNATATSPQDSPILFEATVEDASAIANASLIASDGVEQFPVPLLSMQAGNLTLLRGVYYNTSRPGIHTLSFQACDEQGLCTSAQASANVTACNGIRVLAVQESPVPAAVSSGYCIARWSKTSHGSPPLVYASRFQAVVWNEENNARPVEEAEARMLSQLLANQTRGVALIGSDVMLSTANNNSNASSLLEGLFGARVAKDVAFAQVEDVPTKNSSIIVAAGHFHPLTRGLPAALLYVTNSSPYPDSVQNTSGRVIASFNQTFSPAVVEGANSSGKAIFIPFAFEALGANATVFERNAIKWLLEERTQQVILLNWSENSYFVENASNSLALSLNATTLAALQVFYNSSAQYLLNASSGTINLSAPTQPGAHLVRVQARTAGEEGEGDYFDNAFERVVRVAPDAPDAVVEQVNQTGKKTGNTSVSVGLANVGGRAMNATLVLLLDGNSVASQNISLAAGSKVAVLLAFNASQGIHDLSASAQVAGEYSPTNNAANSTVYSCDKQSVIIIADDDVERAPESAMESAREFERALGEAGYCTTVWSEQEKGTPSAGDLWDYPALIWSAGRGWNTTLGTADQELLSHYAGSVFFEGSDLAFDHAFENSSSALRALGAAFESDLFIESNSSLAVNFTGTGAEAQKLLAGIASNESNFSVNGSKGPFPDAITPVSNDSLGIHSFPAANYSSGGTAIALANSSFSARAYYSFSFTALEPEGARRKLAANTVEWLLNHTRREWQLNLTKGWNFVSFASLPNDSSVSNVLSPIEGKYSSLKTYNSTLGKWQSYEAGVPPSFQTLSKLSFGEGYWILMAQDALYSPGYSKPPSITRVPLARGWSMFSWPYSPKTVQAALAGLDGVYYKVQAYNASTEKWSTFDSSVNSTFNTLSTLKPGEAYWILSAQNTTLSLNG